MKTRPGLDTLRFLAAETVVIGHACNLWFPTTFMARIATGYGPRHDFLYVQNVAVAAFFSLSGFLIAAALDRAGSFSGFIRDRADRIFRPLIPVVLLIWIIEAVTYGHGYRTAFQTYDLSSASALLSATLLISHPVMLAFGADNGAIGDAQQLWTIALEWWIYVAAGAFMLGRSKVIISIGLFAAIMPAWHVLKGDALPLAWIAGACVWKVRHAIRHVHGCAALAVGTVTLGLAGGNVYGTLPCILLGAGLLIVFMDCGRLAVAEQGAKWTYPLYLIHLPVLFAAHALYPAVYGGLLGIALANGVAFGFWHLLDRIGHIRRPPARTASLLPLPSPSLRSRKRGPSVRQRPGCRIRPDRRARR